MALLITLFGALSCDSGDASRSAKHKSAGPDLEALRSLGYLDAAPRAAEGVDVTVHDPAKAYAGLNLYAVGDEVSGANVGRHHRWPRARLMNMHGTTVHSWVLDDSEIGWQHVEALPNGDLLGIAKGYHLVRLDWNSHKVWQLPLDAHHDLDVTEGGRIYVLTRGDHRTRYAGKEMTILDNGVAIVSADGKLEEEIWLFELLRGLVPERKLRKALEAQATASADEASEERNAALRKLDILHVNTVEVLDRNVPGLGRKGQLLLSVRDINQLAVLDVETREIVWSYGENDLIGQHEPTVLQNNNLLVFDNGSKSRAWSRVLEVNPSTGTIVWRYPPQNSEDFYSGSRSGCHQLPNGNFMITVANAGRALEVTREHEIVWQWHNPIIVDGKPALVYRMERLPLDYFDANLRGNGDGGG